MFEGVSLSVTIRLAALGFDQRWLWHVGVRGRDEPGYLTRARFLLPSLVR